MTFELRPWRISDAPDLAAALNNPHVLDNLRDGLRVTPMRWEGKEKP